MKNQKKSKYSEWLLHDVESAYYGSDCAEDVVGLLQDLYKKIKGLWLKTPFITSKTVFEKVMKEILEYISEFEDFADDVYLDHINNVVANESAWLKDFTNKNYEIPSTLASAVAFSSMGGLGSYKEIVSADSARISRDISSTLRTAYLTKQPLSKVTESLDKKLKVEEKKVSTEAKTINESAFDLTSYLIYKRNKETVVYSSVLDTTTCLECASYHGQEFSIEEAPVLPLHPNCMCSLVPLDVFNDGNEFSNFSEWIEQLSEDDKVKVLGKWRYELYKKGIKPSKFVPDHEPTKKADWKL